MKRMAKWLLGIFAALALAVGGMAAFLILFRPRVRPPTTEVVQHTPDRLARGTYLMENLLSCKHCHSPPDLERYGMPVAPGMVALSGGLLIDRTFQGFPGVVQPPNITPDVETGIGAWTDGELMRAIREGVKRDGTTIFPSMPYGELSALSDEDLRSVVVYLRAQTPARRKTVPTEVDFPVNLLVRLEPAPVAAPVHAPDSKDPIAWGGYLVRIAGCKHCHTPVDKGSPVEAEAFSGGFVFEIPTQQGRRRVVTANITPDPTGYFGRATKAEWIGRVRSFAAMRKDPPHAPPGTNTLMLWLEYSGLTDADLGAIYDYMLTVRPVRKTVVAFPDAPAAQTAGVAP